MDIKEYIERFDEISHLSRDQQFVVLEQVRDEIQLNSVLPCFAAIAFIVRVSCIFVFLGGSYLFWGLSTLAIVLSVFLGLVISRVIITEIKDHLMLKVLKSILNKKAI
ncbi:hypothetical protein [Thalassotalea atypica]|uniref:hypothetical protein n=1 Tax=Thalassotalea atypica TaxID=2054316 RepID=UPI002573C520|nr:hypothetical protein [Thalassotalea atypica]